MGLAERWNQRVWRKLLKRDQHFTADPMAWSLALRLRSLLPRELEGLVLDAGAGNLSLRRFLDPERTRYLSMEIERTHGALSLLGDLQALGVRSGSLDAVLCSQVLEHLPHPCAAVAEMARILRPGGKAILTVPHLSYLHGEPHDYFRYTPHGVRSLLEEAGLETIRIEKVGGLLAFVLAFPSLLLLSLLYPVPLLGGIVRAVNVALVRAGVWLDARIGMSGLCPLNILAVARKPDRG